MADRFQRGSHSQVTIRPFEVPDLQSGFAKQLSFLDTIQKMQQRAAAAAQATSQGTYIGVDPATGEPVYMKGLPGHLTDAQRKQAFAAWSQQKAKTVIGQDEILNRIKGELYGGRPISIKRQGDLLQQARTRTALLAKENGIEPSLAFQQTFGEATRTQAEASAAYDDSGPGSAFLAGLEQGWNTLKSGVAQAFAGSNAEKARIARENSQRNQEIAMANPILRERTLRESEAAAEGKELGYFDAVEGGTTSNLAATAGNLLGTFGPAMVATPALAYAGAPALAASLAPSIAVSALAGQEGYNERVVNTEGLTEQQKEDALDLTNPGAALNLGVNAAAGALLPGRVIPGVKQWAGNQVARKLIGREFEQQALMEGGPRFVGPIHPNTPPIPMGPVNPYGLPASPMQARLLRMGQNASRVTAAPRTRGQLVRDIVANSGENAAIMSGATLGSNAAYNIGTDQNTPLTQGLAQGAVEGALLGVPFGYMHWRGRTKPAPRVSKTNTPENGAATSISSDGTPPAGGGASPEVQQLFGVKPSSTAKTAKVVSRSNQKEWNSTIDSMMNPAEMDVASIIANNAKHFDAETADSLNKNGSFRAWFKDIINAEDDAAIDRLIGEYLASGGDIKDLEYIVTTNASGKWLKPEAKGNLTRIDPSGLGKWPLEKRESFAAGVAYAKQQGENYAAQFQPRDGLSDVLGKLKRGRTQTSTGEGVGVDSPVDPNTPKSPAGATSEPDAPAGPSDSTVEGGRTGGPAQQGVGQNEAFEQSPKGAGDAAGAEAPDLGRNAQGTGPRDQPPGDGTGSPASEAGGGDGGRRNGAPDIAQPEPSSTVDVIDARIRSFATDNATAANKIRSRIDSQTSKNQGSATDAIVDALVSTPFVRKLYNSTSEADLANGVTGATPEAIANAQAYIRYTKQTNLPRDNQTLRKYLAAEMKSRPIEDIYSRENQLC